MFLCSNVVNNNKTKEIAEAVLKHMCDAISKSLGPYGQKTIVATDMANVLMTKTDIILLKI